MSDSKDSNKTPGKVVAFAKDVDSEFRKITWPRGKELVETTKTVTCFILVLALFVWLCDVVLRWAITQMIG